VNFFPFLKTFFEGGVIVSGRKKQPLSVIQGKGRSNHLTKEEIEKREKHEKAMKAGTEKVIPPDRLTKKQKERFEDLASQLLDLGIIDNLDVDILAMYIETYDSYVRVVRSARKMKSKDLDTKFKEYSAKMRTITQLADTCRKLASDLGLTITSRLKLVIPEKEEEKESPMQAFLKRRGNNG